MNKACFTYIVRCADGSLYTGWTNNIDERVNAHNEGRGAKYTRTRGPVQLVYLKAFDTKSEAMSYEYAIKKMKRIEKESLLLSYKENVHQLQGSWSFLFFIFALPSSEKSSFNIACIFTSGLGCFI